MSLTNMPHVEYEITCWAEREQLFEKLQDVEQICKQEEPTIFTQFAG